MEELEEWFKEELEPDGFSLTPTLYNPDNFAPVKGMLYNIPMGHLYKTTKIRTSLELGMFNTFKDNNNLDGFTYQIKQQIAEEFEWCGYHCPWGKSFLPNKRLKKHKFTYY